MVPGRPCGAGQRDGAAFIGQGLGAEQMYTLRRLLDEVLEGGERGTASDAPSPPPTNAP